MIFLKIVIGKELAMTLYFEAIFVVIIFCLATVGLIVVLDAITR